MKKYYLIEEQTTGMVDGFYAYKPSAEFAVKIFKLDFPDLKFVITETDKLRVLHESEVINRSEWYDRARS